MKEIYKIHARREVGENMQTCSIRETSLSLAYTGQELWNLREPMRGSFQLGGTDLTELGGDSCAA